MEYGWRLRSFIVNHEKSYQLGFFCFIKIALDIQRERVKWNCNNKNKFVPLGDKGGKMVEGKSIEDKKPEEFVMERNETKVIPSAERYRANIENIKEDYNYFENREETNAEQLKNKMRDLVFKVLREGREGSRTNYLSIDKLTVQDRKTIEDCRTWIDDKEKFFNAIKNSGECLGELDQGSTLIIPDGRGLGHWRRDIFVNYTSDNKDVYVNDILASEDKVSFIQKKEIMEKLDFEQEQNKLEVEKSKRKLAHAESNVKWMQEILNKLKSKE